jgi:hypothetical protein
MRLPRFTAEKSLYQSSARYRGTRASGQNGVAVHPAQLGPINPYYFCALHPAFCESLFLNLKVGWIPNLDGLTGWVIVQGSGFPGNRKVTVEIKNCEYAGQSAYPSRTTTSSGVFSIAQKCYCEGMTTVTATDSITHASVQATAQMPCY